MRPGEADERASATSTQISITSEKPKTNRRGKAVGDLAGRKRQHEQRQELREPDQPEVERVAGRSRRPASRSRPRAICSRSSSRRARPRAARSRAAAALQAGVAGASSRLSHTEKPAGSGPFEPSSAFGSLSRGLGAALARHERRTENRRAQVAAREVERRGEVRRGSRRARRERRQAEAPLDQLQDRRVVEDRVVDMRLGARTARPAASAPGSRAARGAG